MKKYEFIYDEMSKIFPQPKCELDYSNPFTLLIAVILSAQCTDKRVNQVTPELFKKFPTAKELASADSSEVEDIIRSCGFYRNKANSIIACSRDLCEKYGGEVPSTIEKLVQLKGVGRKTANVVLSVVFGVPALAVDTHVFRVSNRLGLSNSTTAEQCEKDLMKLLPKKMWSNMHQLFVLFGRYHCKAQNPYCINCPLNTVCNHYKKTSKNKEKSNDSN